MFTCISAIEVVTNVKGNALKSVFVQLLVMYISKFINALVRLMVLCYTVLTILWPKPILLELIHKHSFALFYFWKEWR